MFFSPKNPRKESGFLILSRFSAAPTSSIVVGTVKNAAIGNGRGSFFPFKIVLSRESGKVRDSPKSCGLCQQSEAK